MSDYEESFASGSDASQPRLQPVAAPPSVEEDDPLSILDQLQSYKSGGGFVSGLVPRLAIPAPAPGPAPGVTVAAPPPPDSDHYSSDHYTSAGEVTARSDPQQTQKHEHAVQPSFTFGQPFVNVQDDDDVSVHTAHQSESSYTPREPHRSRKNPELEYTHLTATTLRQKPQSKHRDSRESLRSHSRRQSRSRSRSRSMDKHKSHSKQSSKQSLVSREGSSASRAAYNDILLRTVTPDVAGGVLLTPAAVKPKYSPEDWAIQQAIGLAGLSKPQPVIHGLPDRMLRGPTRSPSVNSDDETEYTESTVEVTPPAAVGPSAVDTEILELLVRLAVLETAQNQQCEPSVPPVVEAPPVVRPAAPSNHVRNDSLDSTPPVHVDIQLPPVTGASTQETLYLSSHHPTWQSELKQGYDVAVSALLTALRDCDGNHAVVSALSDALDGMLKDGSVVSLVQHAVLRTLTEGKVENSPDDEGMPTDRPLPRSALPEPTVHQPSAVPRPRSLTPDQRDDVLYVPALVEPSRRRKRRSKSPVVRGRPKSTTATRPTHAHSVCAPTGPPVVVLPVYQSIPPHSTSRRDAVQPPPVPRRKPHLDTQRQHSALLEADFGDRPRQFQASQQRPHRYATTRTPTVLWDTQQ